MTHEEQLENYPTQRLAPFDGMAVTAAVWEEAHGYHRTQQRFHARFGHGSGILAGLEVIACDPPDSSVYIRPGIAIDPLGRTIAVPEPVAYDFGDSSEGLAYLTISYGESRPRRVNGHDGETERLYVQTGFSVEASSKPVGSEGLELARVRRSSRDAALTDADDAAYPQADEIDLRFRHHIGAQAPAVATIAVSYPGAALSRHGRGAGTLARKLRRTTDALVWVDDDVPLTTDLDEYTLVYLVARDRFELDAEALEALYEYVTGGGTVLLESCRHESGTDEEPPADESFADMLESLGIETDTVEDDHPLLHEPHRFAAPPRGADDGTIVVGDGVILSTSDYGCLWNGTQRNGHPSREAIRTACEWGENLIAHALRRRETAGER